LWSVPLGGTVFLDGGDVTRTASGLDSREPALAVGSGVWTKLGRGGLRSASNVGYRLNRQASEDDAFANVSWHLGNRSAY